jgi:hypothetical protein
MNNPKSSAAVHSGWNVSFWFAVLSPVLGAATAFLTLLLFYR